MFDKIPFSQIGCVVTTVSFLYQVAYVIPEQQRQFRIIKKHLNIQEENLPKYQSKKYVFNTEYFMEMRKYND